MESVDHVIGAAPDPAALQRARRRARRRLVRSRRPLPRAVGNGSGGLARRRSPVPRRPPAARDRRAGVRRADPPRVEPEIAFVLGADLRPVEACAALEVVDSIWRDYRFSLELNTADGSSAAGVVLGPPLALDALDTVSVRLLRNGIVVGEGTGAAAMGHPLRALEWLGQRVALEPGDVVITGGLTAAVPIEGGDVVVADFDGVEVRLSRALIAGSGRAAALGPSRRSLSRPACRTTDPSHGPRPVGQPRRSRRSGCSGGTSMMPMRRPSGCRCRQPGHVVRPACTRPVDRLEVDRP